MSAPQPWIVRGDVDGFFGLFIDNLVQLLLIVQIVALCGIGGGGIGGGGIGDASTVGLLTGSILPGAAVGILLGNLFYWWQARRLARRTGSADVTALPYGINTPSLLLFVYAVMVPAYEGHRGEIGDAAAAELAWQCGMLACLGSGLIELAGAAVAERIRRATPRAALLATLGGIAVSFIAMTFFVQAFQYPLVSLVPIGIVFLTYFSRVRFPAGLPGGLVALLVGTAIAWTLSGLAPDWLGGRTQSWDAVADAWATTELSLPRLRVFRLWEIAAQPAVWLPFAPVIAAMGVFNVIGSLQNVESAAVEGDEYAAGPSLAANGLGTIVSAAFGGCFPTTIYIGHPGWKAIGARSAYSAINGLAIAAVCCLGATVLISRLVPIEAGLGIVIWIGVAIIAQAFRAVPERHGIAVALGLLPAIAAWGATVVGGAFFAAGGATLQDAMAAAGETAHGSPLAVNGFFVHGLIALERGYLFTCMIVTAIAVCLIDRRLRAAAAWSAIAAALTGLGATHAYQVAGNVVDYRFRGAAGDAEAIRFDADGIALGYLGLAAVLLAASWLKSDAADGPPHREGAASG